MHKETSDGARGIDLFEKDTEQDEDEVLRNLDSLLLPAGCFPTDKEKFACGYSSALLNGWVKQPSPCCAAASVSGAWNALAGRGRNDSGAFSHTTVVDALAETLRQRIEAKRARFERMLGAPLQPLLEVLEAKLAAEGRMIGGVKEAAATKTIVLKLVRKAVQEALAETERLETFDRLAELYALEKPSDISEELVPHASDALDEGRECVDISESDTNNVPVTSVNTEVTTTITGVATVGSSTATIVSSATTTTENIITDNAENEENEVIESEGEDEQLVDTPNKAHKRRSSSEKPVWLWKNDLYELIKQQGGLVKLTAERASTAAFGNIGVARVIEYLSAERIDASGMRVSASLFMGKKCKAGGLDVPLRQGDDEASIEKQWQALRTAFLGEKQVVLFHLKNHYALIFALREWRDKGENGVWTRQLLTARKGQRPTVWIDFEEARQTMLGWSGYKMLLLTRLPSD